MTSRRVFVLALATQSVLIGAAWAASSMLDLPPRWGAPGRDVVIGLAGAAGLASANYLLLTRARRNWLVDGVRAVYHGMLVPLFARLGPSSIIVLGAAAGVSEEWLFRGVLQPLIGWTAASAVFGLAHVGGRNMLAFGVWASGMGLALGGLANLTGGLIAPVVAHSVYDMLALEFIRRGAPTE